MALSRKLKRIARLRDLVLEVLCTWPGRCSPTPYIDRLYKVRHKCMAYLNRAPLKVVMTQVDIRQWNLLVKNCHNKRLFDIFRSPCCSVMTSVSSKFKRTYFRPGGPTIEMISGKFLCFNNETTRFVKVVVHIKMVTLYKQIH